MFAAYTSCGGGALPPCGLPCQAHRLMPSLPASLSPVSCLLTHLLPTFLQVAEAPALGCAILAAVAAGMHPDVPTACAAMVHQVWPAGWQETWGHT